MACTRTPPRAARRAAASLLLVCALLGAAQVSVSIRDTPGASERKQAAAARTAGRQILQGPQGKAPQGKGPPAFVLERRRASTAGISQALKDSKNPHKKPKKDKKDGDAVAQTQSAELVTAAAAIETQAITTQATVDATIPARKTVRRPPRYAVKPQIGYLQYKQALGHSFLFFEAQRSGKLPAGNRVPWRGNAFINDRVPGGWHDAGDHIKHSLTTAHTTMFLAWSALDFPRGYTNVSQLGYAKASIKWGADYLAACHIAPYQYVGLIGNPDIDHEYWGRPEEQPGPRTPYIWGKANAASDMLGMASAALASSSMLFKRDNATYAAAMLTKAEQLYRWAVEKPGGYSKTLLSYPKWLYPSTTYQDKLFLAAAWLHRATGNATYLTAAYKHYKAFGGRWELSPYVSWGDQSAAAVTLLLGTAQRIGPANVPGYAEYADFFATDFMQTYLKADGTWGVIKTPLGLRLYDWSQWGNLRYSSNVAFMALLRAASLPLGQQRTTAIQFAKQQIDYALGSTGRSYVVGMGTTPPVQAHHSAASCPNRPASCTWDQFYSKLPNPQVLRGALVAGPRGPGDKTYTDVRSDYVSNEVAIDYNAGLTGALAGLIQFGV